MSAATSPGTGCLRPAAGLRRLGQARSSFYAMTSGQHAEQPPAKRRGPKPAISDQALLVAIEADLESPWEGEGYRKVWARLRVCRDIRVARKRVLRLMRENNLLSPHRCRRRGGNPHDGEISLDASHQPHDGTDGVRRVRGRHGRWGWIVTAVEHWKPSLSAGMSASAASFAAMQPISMGLAGRVSRTAAGAARGPPCGWITAPSICRTTSPTRSSSGASSRPTPSSPSPRPRVAEAVQSHAEGTDHPWSRDLPNIVDAGVSAIVERTMPADRRKKDLSPVQARRQWHARRKHNAA